MFREIAFVDSEKNGVKIPLSNVIDRLHVMLGLSRQSIANLRQEMSQLMDEDNDMEDLGTPPRPRTRRRTTSDSQQMRKQSGSIGRKGRLVWASSLINKIIDMDHVPVPKSPMKKGRVGRKKITLTELEENTIRYQFHLLLTAKEYPTERNRRDRIRRS